MCENLATTKFTVVQRGHKFRMSEICIFVPFESYFMRADVTVLGFAQT
jgi:hypothetical protein